MDVSEVAMSQGLAYAWGWQDAGGSGGVDSYEFAVVWQAVVVAHERGDLSGRMSIQDGFTMWREDKCIAGTTKTGGVLFFRTEITDSGTVRVVETER